MHGCRCSGPRSASPRCAPGRQVPVRRFGAGSVAIPAAIGVAFLSAIAASAARALIAYSCVARSPKPPTRQRLVLRLGDRPAETQDAAGGSCSLNLRASSSRFSGSADSRGTDRSASTVRRNCCR